MRVKRSARTSHPVSCSLRKAPSVTPVLWNESGRDQNLGQRRKARVSKRIEPRDMHERRDRSVREVVIVGGGIAGLSAAIYLGRAQRDTLVIDSGHSMAKWEPVVENYLGFRHGVAGEQLLKNGRAQAKRHKVRFAHDEIKNVAAGKSIFILKGKKKSYRCQRLLLATGIFHRPPEIPGVNECLGHSMFFCKDCDGYRVRGKRIAIIGQNNETVEYALG